MALVILLVDGYWIIQAGVTAATAVGALLAGLGAIALLICAIEGVKNKQKLQHQLFTAGTVFTALGCVVLAGAAVMAVVAETGATGAS
ncbi:hypothetical protein [Arthrobacter oryzae]|uniref:hypothetical protein n=1 Tax=Arthrobacter oryzae TaxID=409290 RepID=UPI002781AF16|nr:hypothetical protein [Arthrobacter oryzae]MDQ0077913.1 TRAP-type mannitol/chloroaromatic compound transport system permease large subunit [Arthrobacter oryzae]